MKRAYYVRMCDFAGGSLTVLFPGYNDLYGNNVTRRENVLDRAARKSFIDFSFLLPDSRVTAFYIYVNNTVGTQDLRLQVWRPVDITIRRWQLVWQQEVRVTNTKGGLYTVSSLH